MVNAPARSYTARKVSCFGALMARYMFGAPRKKKFRIQKNVDSRFIQYSPSSSDNVGYSPTSKGANFLCYAIDMITTRLAPCCQHRAIS